MSHQYSGTAGTGPATPPKVLLLIDCQKGFITEHTAHLPERWAWFLDHAGPIFDQVIASRWVNTSHSAFVRSGYTRMHRDDPDTALVPEVAVRLGEPPERSGYPVPGHLLSRSPYGPTQVFLAGVDTDACITATALSLYTSQYAPTVISDLCGSSAGADLHTCALDLLRRNLGATGVRDARQVISAL